MSKIYEIKNAVNFLIKHGLSKKNLKILHCTSLYPTKLNDLNLNYILFLKKKFKFEIGFSDHTKDFLAPIMASSLGVNIFEKHITLSNKMKGPDHSSSMEVKQLHKLIKVLNDSKIALNGSKKKTLIKEEVTKKISRKSIFAISRIKRGEFFSKKNIAILRPNTGIEPKNYLNLIGKKSKKNYLLYEAIKK